MPHRHRQVLRDRKHSAVSRVPAVLAMKIEPFLHGHTQRVGDGK
jgi:hypothetical protein